MSVVESQPNPATIEALLDTTWRVAAIESERTEILDRKATGVATFASVLATLTATLAIRFVEHFHTWWSLALFVAGLVFFLGAVALALRALWPRAYLTLGVAYLERFTTWSEVRKRPEQARGDTMQGLIDAIAYERQSNVRKAEAVRASLGLLGIGLVLLGAEAATLAIDEVLDGG